MKRTFIDTGVLIAAARGQNDVAVRAMAILDDPNREFASSLFVKLEVLPKAIYNQKTLEAAFYQAFFDGVTHWAKLEESLIANAFQEACQLGLSAIDALHVAAALSVNAEELITTEKPSKPIHRVTKIKVISIALNES
ncbi:type II toxin-antitoxin system VapC family toxin [Coleofasciculus sp. E1-EBD-02]|uniref:type II toxin-antitoxin system VapC family toxin n=1 Tax=Coleofasciculus sp. E1-EBD-02 TaxID=3068481 RepID=UPI0033026FE1